MASLNPTTAGAPTYPNVLSAPPNVDDLRRYEDAGITSLVSWPLLFTVGPRAPLDVKRRHLETYANDVIAKLR